MVLFFNAMGLLRQQLHDGTRLHGIIQQAAVNTLYKTKCKSTHLVIILSVSILTNFV